MKEPIQETQKKSLSVAKVLSSWCAANAAMEQHQSQRMPAQRNQKSTNQNKKQKNNKKQQKTKATHKQYNY